MLDGLSLTGRGALRDGPTHEDDEFLDAGALEVAEVADVGGVGEDDRVGSVRVDLQHQQGCDLHDPSPSFDGSMDRRTRNLRRVFEFEFEIEMGIPANFGAFEEEDDDPVSI